MENQTSRVASRGRSSPGGSAGRRNRKGSPTPGEAESRSSGERERQLTERWSNQAADRARFEALFSNEFVRDARQQGSVFDLCALCNRPYWIQYANLVNWSLYWKGPPRCYACYAPPLTDRVRREHPEWTPLHVSHEIIMAIYGYGSYAQALELTSSRAWWVEHERDYCDKENPPGAA